MIDVFISYGSEDRNEAAALAGFLEDKGYRVWWDRDLLAGEDFHSTIEGALEECKVAIVIWTESSIKSRWVLGEADDAASRRKLVPVRIDALDPKLLPVGFRALHTVALSDRGGLISAIAAHLAIVPKAEPAWKVVGARLRRAARRLRRQVTFARVAAVGVAVAFIMYLGFDALDWWRIRDLLAADEFKTHQKWFPFSLFGSSVEAKLAGTNEWPAVEGSRNSSDLESYLRRYPASMYSSFLRLRLGRLQAVAAGKYKPLISDSSTRPLSDGDLQPMGCEDLWRTRNEIYYGLGYCFLTSDGMTKFNTSGDCPYHACQIVGTFNDWINNEILSAVEQRNIKAIQDVEKQKQCRVTPVPGACSRP